jgi:diacylglycerol kinase (ATP)
MVGVRGGTALVLRNPRARRPANPRDLEDAARRLGVAGWAIEVRDTHEPGEATPLARAAAEAGTDVVFACGGDGTIREVAQGLVGTSTALGAIPSGTANVWAKEAGIPSSPAAALALLVRGRRRRIDTGLVNGRRFLLMCSAGLDAAVVRAVVLPALRGTMTAPPYRVRLRFDGGDTLERDLLLVVAGNSRLYGGVARLTALACIDDGLLDVCALTAPDGHAGALYRARLGIDALRGALPSRAASGALGVTYRQARAVTIEVLEPGRALPYQLDGDYGGAVGPGGDVLEDVLRIEVDPASLTVLVGPGHHPIFGAPGDATEAPR